MNSPPAFRQLHENQPSGFGAQLMTVGRRYTRARAAAATRKPSSVAHTQPKAETNQQKSIHRKERKIDIKRRLLAVRSPLPTEEPVTEKIVFTKKVSGIKRLRDEFVQLVVWRRDVLPKFVERLEDASIKISALPSFFGIMEPADFTVHAKEIQEQMVGNKKSALSEKDISDLVKDMDALVHMFVKLTGTKYVKVKLEPMDDDGCTYWHQVFRLISTAFCSQFIVMIVFLPNWLYVIRILFLTAWLPLTGGHAHSMCTLTFRRGLYAVAKSTLGMQYR
jgi:hypothetical protein